MTWLRWSARLFAVAVFTVSLGVHIVTLSGRLVEWREVQFFASFLAITVSSWVFLPGVRAMKSPPLLLLLVIGSGFVYTTGYGWVTQVASGVLFVGGSPGGVEGDRHLSRLGKRVLDISEQEYQQAKLSDARQWSAANAVFAFFAVVISVVPLRSKAESVPLPADTPQEPLPASVPPGG